MPKSKEDSLFPDWDETIKVNRKSGESSLRSVEIATSTGEESTGKLTKAELAEILASVLGLSDTLCQQLVVSYFKAIKNSLITGQDVKISGFGTFHVKHKTARPGRNPKTGEAAIVSPRKVVTFKPSRGLRHQVDEESGN